MKALVLPTGADPFYAQTTSLDGRAYILDFAFNQRAACWYLSLATLEGAPIASGMKLVCTWDLLRKCASPLRPPGKLMVLARGPDRSTPGLLDLLPTGRCFLAYFTQGDIAALRAGTA